MGVKRGAHMDGEDVCPKFVFKIPGGKNPDGSTLWGWNDAAAASCARCGSRDLDHVVLRDFTAEAMEKDREKYKRGEVDAPDNIPGITQVREGKKAAARSGAPPSTIDATARNPASMDVSMKARNIEPLNPIQMFELEPGVPDPLAMNAYQEATTAQRQRAEAESKKRAEQEAAALVAKASAAMAGNTATGGAEGDTGGEETDENARFKAEVERAIKEQVTAPPPSTPERGQRRERERTALKAWQFVSASPRLASPHGHCHIDTLTPSLHCSWPRSDSTSSQRRWPAHPVLSMRCWAPSGWKSTRPPSTRKGWSCRSSCR